MATFVAEAIVSASVELLLGKIVSGEFVDFFRSTKLDYSLLENLETTLLSLQAVLNDAEQKQITDGAVQKWLVKLQDAVFHAEDLFDQINTEALRCQVKAEQKGKRAKLRKFLSSYSYKTINSEMKELHIKLNNLVGQVHLLGLKEGVSSIVWHSTPTSCVAEDESTIYGRDSDKEKLKVTLLSLQAVLNDAEQKQITNPAVKDWLFKLQHAVLSVAGRCSIIQQKHVESSGHKTNMLHHLAVHS